MKYFNLYFLYKKYNITKINIKIWIYTYFPLFLLLLYLNLTLIFI